MNRYFSEENIQIAIKQWKDGQSILPSPSPQEMQNKTTMN